MDITRFFFCLYQFWQCGRACGLWKGWWLKTGFRRICWMDLRLGQTMFFVVMEGVCFMKASFWACPCTSFGSHEVYLLQQRNLQNQVCSFAVFFFFISALWNQLRWKWIFSSWSGLLSQFSKVGVWRMFIVWAPLYEKRNLSAAAYELSNS